MYECDRDGCSREFETKQGLGQHISHSHESDDEYKKESVLQSLYIGQKLSAGEIADKFSIAKATVYDWLDRHDIETRPSTHEKPPNFRTNTLGYEEVRNQYKGQQYSIFIHRLMAVAEYGIDQVSGVDVHHLNDIPWDNRPANIDLISRSEHVSQHHSEGLYDGHLEEVHQHRHDDGRLARVPVELAGGED